MKVQRNDNNSCVLVENKEGQILYIANNGHMGYFSMETVPCEGDISFRINAISEDEIEIQVYQAFRELLDDILDNYFKVGFIRMQIDLKNRFIRFMTPNPNYNSLEIKLDGEALDIVMTIYRGKKSNFSNNRVFLDNDDVLAMGYYGCFQKLLNKLIVVAIKEQTEEVGAHR